ncbi:hypothetical protein [Nostoc phage NMeng1]|nr:hypothetical protein [Nostoc phage NMeng1]
MAEWERLRAKFPHAEGMMLHTCTKPFSPGKRAPGMLRYKPQPTIDLRVESWEEAVSEDGTPLGMVGRCNVLLNRVMSDGVTRQSRIGIGPGKLTHDERTAIWNKFRESGYRPIVEVKYMPDPTYDALRQPTIQRIRDDKEKADVLSYQT